MFPGVPFVIFISDNVFAKIFAVTLSCHSYVQLCLYDREAVRKRTEGKDIFNVKSVKNLNPVNRLHLEH